MRHKARVWADTAWAEGTGGVPLSPCLENGWQEKYESEADKSAHTGNSTYRGRLLVFVGESVWEFDYEFRFMGRGKAVSADTTFTLVVLRTLFFSLPKTNFYFQSKKKKIWTIEYARMLIPHKHEKCVIDLLKFSLRRHLFYWCQESPVSVIQNSQR